MRRVGRFEKVSEAQFVKDFLDSFPEKTNADAKTAYAGLKLPQRATRGSAGYDFLSTVDFTLNPGETIKIPTGIRSSMDEDWVLMIFPRSGLGFKYRLQLNNTVGVIDSDYYGSANEGHIFIKVTNDSNEGKVLKVNAGKGFAQGIFLPYGITGDDEAAAERDGGFGSTGV